MDSAGEASSVHNTLPPHVSPSRGTRRHPHCRGCRSTTKVRSGEDGAPHRRSPRHHVLSLPSCVVAGSSHSTTGRPRYMRRKGFDGPHCAIPSSACQPMAHGQRGEVVVRRRSGCRGRPPRRHEMVWHTRRTPTSSKTRILGAISSRILCACFSLFHSLVHTVSRLSKFVSIFYDLRWD